VPSHSEFTDPADHVGHTVSTDVKKKKKSCHTSHFQDINMSLILLIITVACHLHT